MERELLNQLTTLEDHHWWWAGRRAIIDWALRRISLPANADILEAGCGGGGNLKRLGQLGKLYAFEYDEQTRASATSRGVCEVAAGELPGNIPYAPKQFDLVAMFDVLEHIKDDVGTLRALHARIKPGGYLLMTVPAFPFLWSEHDKHHHHFRRYKRGELRHLVEHEGFKINYCSYFNFFLFPVAVATRLLERVMPKKASRLGYDIHPNSLSSRLLAAVMGGERHLLGLTQLPFGLSILLIARKS